MKKETLEEASERIRKELIYAPVGIIPNFNDGFEQGVKWQQEQNKNKFSEEEVKLLIDFVKDCATNWDCDNDSHKYNTPCRMCDAQKVLEQFKKK